MEINGVIFNKSNFYFLFSKADISKLNSICESINTAQQDLKMISNVSGYYSGDIKKTKDFRLYVGLTEATPKRLQALLHFLGKKCLFCHNDCNVDGTLREIIFNSYVDYSDQVQEEQSIHVGKPILVSGMASVTGWDPSDPKTQAAYINEDALDYHKIPLKSLWKTSVESDLCAFYSWKNIRFNIVPSISAKERQCQKLKNILDRMTPSNPNWIVKYNKKAHCHLKCDNQELAEKIYKKVSSINKQLDRKIGANSDFQAMAIEESDLKEFAISNFAEISYGKHPSDNESVYVIIKDEFISGQIELSSFGKQCVTCGKNEEKMLKCGACQKQYYCSKECQKTDWPNHKKKCKLL